MGAWGVGHLENDAALDWLGGLEDGGGADGVRGALDAAIRSDYVHADGGCEALAAAEVVAAALGRPCDDPAAGRLVAFARAHAELGDLVEQALAAVDATADPEASELYELWHEGDDEEEEDESEWDAAVDDLRMRLGTAA